MNLAPRASHSAVLGLLVLLVGAAYGNTLRNDFVYDDTTLIRDNERLRRLDAIPQLLVSDWWKGAEQRIGRVQPSDGTPDSGDRRYRPLVTITYVLNYLIGGPTPLGYHLVNVLLHGLVSWVLYLVALEVGWSAGAALVAAVLFALHPLHSEAVAWVVGRPELLMALGVLAGLWCALRGYRWWALAAFVGGLLSKEQAVVLPALVLLAEVCAGRLPRGPNRGRAALARYGGYVLVLAAFLLARTLILGGFQPVAYPFLESPLEYASGGVWVLSTLKLAGRYLWLCVWPAALSVDYSYNAIPLATSGLDPGVLWAVGAWGGLLGLAAWGFRRDRRISFAVGVTVLSFAPAANVLVSVGTPLAERLFYLPLAGLCLLAGLAYEHATGQQTAVSGQPSASPVTRHWALLVVVLICLALTLRTVVRTQDWANNESLFRSAVQVVPGNAKAHALQGDEFMKKKNRASGEQALAAYQTALGLYPDYLTTHAGFATNLGSLLLDLGRTKEAGEVLELAVAVNPQWSVTHYNLGLVYAKLGQYDKAEEAWRQALSLRPEDPQVHSSLSRLAIERGRYAEGLAEAESALAGDPQYVMAQYNRALALQAMGRLEEAAAGYERVLALPSAPEEAKRDVIRKLRDLRAPAGSEPHPARMCIPGLAAC